MTKILEGCWDCEYCGTKLIRGGLRNCPGCGHPRDKNVKFYLGEARHYVEHPEDIDPNPDWICSFCDALNPNDAAYCEGCGASKEDSERNYFEQRRLEEEQNKPKEEPRPQGSPIRFLLMLGIVAAIFFAFVSRAIPRTKTITITDKQWTRTEEIEVYKAVEESSWSLPAEAYNVKTRSEVYAYENVLSHYVTRYRTVAHQVLDGYDTYTTYEDMGNGYFREVEHSTPRYRTEYVTEEYQEPVYIRMPIYRDKYYYTLEKWIVDRTLTTSGDGDEEPHFKKVKLGEGERIGTQIEEYTIIVNRKTYSTSFDIWQEAEVGRKYKVTISDYKITKMEAVKK
ncbi:MAG: zinc ribbon domain-containing protein [Erysipelotrichaceae bacterium]|nr:zinc ribbon domain-containing protein [Erysipelotrichaceae bacterium]